MKIRWSIDDGYVNRGRWHTCEIPDDQFDEDMTEDEKRDFIDEWIGNEFTNQIYYFWEIV